MKKQIKDAEYLKLISYVHDLPHGELILFQDVQTLLDIDMRISKNRSKLAKAIIHCKREYQSVRNIGFKLGEPQTVIPIVGTRIKKVHSQLKRLGTVHENLSVFLPEMSKDDRARFERTAMATKQLESFSNQEQFVYSPIRLSKRETLKIPELG